MKSVCKREKIEKTVPRSFALIILSGCLVYIKFYFYRRKGEMGKERAPCCEKNKVKSGPWSPQEDLRLITFIQKHGHTNCRSLPKQADLLRCGKSCRLRWLNYLRPDIKRGNFTKEDEDTITKLHHKLGNKWSKIASYFPGRTDNEIKNVWNTSLKKRLNEKERGHINHHKDETKELSKSTLFSSSSSCTSNLSLKEDLEVGDRIGGEKQQNDESKENASPSNFPGALHYFSNTNQIDVDIMQTEDTNFLINFAYEENYEMFLNMVQDNDIYPPEFDFEYLEMLEKEDHSYPYQSQTKELEICQRTIEENEKENECMKWIKNIENELLLEITSDAD